VLDPESVFLRNVSLPANSTCTVTATLLAGSPGTYIYSDSPFYDEDDRDGPPPFVPVEATVTVVSSIAAIPALSSWALLMLSVAIVVIAWRR
jgi:IPTL-CTERM motif